MNILLTGVGGPTPRGIATALRRYGRRRDYRIIGTDTNPYARGLYETSLFDRTHVVPRAHDSTYWPALVKLVARESIDIALVQSEDEVEVWSRRLESNDVPCVAFVPPYPLVMACRDKGALAGTLAPLRLAPLTFPVRGSDQRGILDALEKVGLPCWVRSPIGASGLGACKIEAKKDLNAWLMLNRHEDHFIVSEFLPGRNLACKLLFWRGSLLRAACAERVTYFMAKVTPSGVTGVTALGRLINDETIVDVSERAVRRVADECGVEPNGLVTVDLKESVDGHAKVTEINVRHVGFTAMFAAGGANFADDTITLLTEGESALLPYKYYHFDKEWAFIRDIDLEPLLVDENEILARSEAD
jgi:glutathione synthase/RimK-type ligase-like ATP-grasp enzyme